jgi:hypothetical protein
MGSAGSSKGMSLAGLIDLVSRGEIGRSSTALYAHLGGQPAITRIREIRGVRGGVMADKEESTMKTVNSFLVRRPTLLSLAALAISLLVAACSPGGSGGSGY